MVQAVDMSRADEIEIVTWFSGHMQHNLDQNASKGRVGWRDLSLGELHTGLTDEFDELTGAVFALRISEKMDRDPSQEQRQALISEAADLANRAMFLADVISST